MKDFKIKLETMIFCLVLLLVNSCGTPPGVKSDPVPTDAPEDKETRELMTRGSELYKANCEACHGMLEVSTLLSVSREQYFSALERSYHRGTVRLLTDTDKEEIFRIISR